MQTRFTPSPPVTVWVVPAQAPARGLLAFFEPAITKVCISKMSGGKQLVRGKSGMRMIAVSENERCPFLLEEPHWTDDAQV